MLVDCQTCPVRNVQCADCMVTALTAIPAFMGDLSPEPAHGFVGGTDRKTHADVEAAPVPLDRAERRAVSAFLAAGLVTTATANAARAVLDPVVTAQRRARRAV